MNKCVVINPGPDFCVRIVFVFGTVSVLMASLFGFAESFAKDRGSVFGLLTQLEKESDREKELISRDRAFMNNIEGKQRIIAEVVTKGLSLRDAAAGFQTLNLSCPEYDWNAFRRTFPGQNDEERHYRQVLAALRQVVNAKSGLP
jgi:hypothetical protein